YTGPTEISTLSLHDALPIYGDPHLGHALEKVGADCIARYRRLRGEQVHFVMGMDEHSQSVVQAAERAGVTPREWVDRMTATFARSEEHTSELQSRGHLVCRL